MSSRTRRLELHSAKEVGKLTLSVMIMGVITQVNDDDYGGDDDDDGSMMID